MTLSITTLSIMGLVTTLSMNDTRHTFSLTDLSAIMLCCYAECRNYLNVMLSVVMLSVVRQNVVMLSVVAPILDQVSAFKKMYPQKRW
jgi:hypothetical protein